MKPRISKTVMPDKRLSFNDWAKTIHRELMKSRNLKPKV